GAVASPERRSLVPAALLVVGAALVVALLVALVGSVVASVVVGLVVLAVGLRLAVVARPKPVDESRRRLLVGIGAAGVAAVAAGSTVGRVTERAVRADPTPDLDQMARSIGSD